MFHRQKADRGQGGGGGGVSRTIDPAPFQRDKLFLYQVLSLGCERNCDYTMPLDFKMLKCEKKKKLKCGDNVSLNQI